jgi:hypothetical protein
MDNVLGSADLEASAQRGGISTGKTENTLTITTH